MEANPTHTFSEHGKYLVKLTAFGAGGQHTVTKNVTITTHTFIRTYDGEAYNHYGSSISQTNDGGYMMFGNRTSKNFYLVKADNLGNPVWQKAYSPDSEGRSAQQTTDGGFILFGTGFYTSSLSDLFLVKTDADGNAVWKKYYGGPNSEYGNSVQQTTDGGYILAGVEDFGLHGYKLHHIKTDNLGNIQWEKTFSLNKNLNFYTFTVKQTTDGGYVLFGTNDQANSGNRDFYLIKTDALGNLLWEKYYGGTGNEEGRCIQQTTDGGYILVGSTDSEGAGLQDIMLLKLDNVGNFVWKKIFGGAKLDSGISVQQTKDGGYILSGSTNGFVPPYHYVDAYMLKTDNAGNFEWRETFGGDYIDSHGYAIQTSDGGFGLLFSTLNEAENFEFELVKTDKYGKVQ